MDIFLSKAVSSPWPMLFSWRARSILNLQVQIMHLKLVAYPLLPPEKEGVKIDFLSLKMFGALQELLITVVYECQISGILTSNSRGGKLVHITVSLLSGEDILQIT